MLSIDRIDFLISFLKLLLFSPITSLLIDYETLLAVCRLVIIFNPD